MAPGARTSGSSSSPASQPEFPHCTSQPWFKSGRAFVRPDGLARLFSSPSHLTQEPHMQNFPTLLTHTRAAMGAYGSAGGTGSSASIDVLAGDWVQKSCIDAGVQSLKKVLRARITAQNTLDYFKEMLTFNGNGCTGASRQAGSSKLGTVTFARSDANQNLAAHWGGFRTVTLPFACASGNGTVWRGVSLCFREWGWRCRGWRFCFRSRASQPGFWTLHAGSSPWRCWACS